MDSDIKTETKNDKLEVIHPNNTISPEESTISDMEEHKSLSSLKISLPSNVPLSPELIGSTSGSNDTIKPQPSSPQPILYKQHSLNTRIPIFDTYSCYRMLFDRYILSDSVMTVNVDSECRAYLTEIFTAFQLYYDQENDPKITINYRNTTISNGWDIDEYVTLFDEAATQIWRLLSSDPFIRFTGTEEYVEFHSMIYRDKR